MLQYIILSIICVGMLLFAVGSAFLAAEEQPYRYDINITDEHEV